MKRRNFIQFLGRGVVATSLLPPFISACNRAESERLFSIDFEIPRLQPSLDDELLLSGDLSYKVLMRYDDPISQTDRFGFNNDYLAFIPGDSKEEGILWVNHEYAHPLFVGGDMSDARTKEQIDAEMYSMGGSLVALKMENGAWVPQLDSAYNRRLNAFTDIPFNWDSPIAGKHSAMGTFQNCAGGVTPWGTVLTCEENYHSCYGERNFETGEIEVAAGSYNWGKFYNNPPEHYGWVVEVDPKTGTAKKHVALGRCAHECATTVELEDKRVVVYTGDDKNDECVYKFIADKPGSLDSGTLYVANMEKGLWESLRYEDRPELQAVFADQTDVLIRLREASKLVGGTPLARPEDIEIDPVTGNVLVALTNNVPKENYFGEILKIVETDGFDSLNFTAETMLAGGTDAGFACPDNLAFDRAGNLWFTSDISGSKIGKEHYAPFKNNGLFVVPRSGPQAGEAIQVGSAPVDAELTGPFFSPDGKTLFLSVQHPGEQSTSMDALTSHWPDGADTVPRPAVVTITGGLLEQIQGLT